MNKLYTLLTLTFITALYSSATLPMNRLARIATRTPKLATKITPAPRNTATPIIKRYAQSVFAQAGRRDSSAQL